MRTFKKTAALLLAVLLSFSALTVFAANAPSVEMTARTADTVKFTAKAEGADSIAIACVLNGTDPACADVNWDIWSTKIVNNVITVNKSDVISMTVPATQKFQVVVRATVNSAFSYAVSVPFSFVPELPVVTSKTDTTIVVKAEEGCEYSINGTDYFAGKDGVVSFSPLTPNTEYTIRVRYAAVPSGEIGASGENSLKVTTLKPAAPVPSAPVLVSYTANTIVVEEVTGVEFSIDGGRTWQTSGTFADLVKSTVYTIVARGAMSESQMASAQSEPLHVRTAARNAFVPNALECKVKVNVPEEEIRVGDKITFTAYGTAAADTTAVEGDIRFVPISWIAEDASGNSVTTGTWAVEKVTQQDTVDTSNVSTDKKGTDIKITVFFAKEQYIDGKWNRISGTTDGSDSFHVRSGYNILEKILVVLNVALQLFNKMVGAIASLIGGKI